ncbi:MAG: hypothetical protein MJA27_06325 [Pseudanabaenales cyanobacterium]|nr:hypothetical protein [Pseudanabaenales cyanobacterium]
MIEALEKEGNSTRQDAAIALSRLGSPAVPALIEALRN